MKPHPMQARRPSIGVTPDLVSRPESPAPHYELKAAYAEAVLRAGGLPLIVPYSEDPACLEGYLDRLSGLLVTGGAFDIPPGDYGDSPREGMGPTNPSRTRFEAALLKGALARNLPVLGVCGGMQLLNVVLGGTLYQDIGRELSAARSHEQAHDRAQPHHPVDLKSGTLLSELLGEGQIMVNSTHHQAVKATGADVRVSAVAPDGVIEAIEATQRRFAVGVQWHPESLIDSVPANLSLYRALVAKAREMRR